LPGGERSSAFAEDDDGDFANDDDRNVGPFGPSKVEAIEAAAEQRRTKP
jgi:hypothetical protein